MIRRSAVALLAFAIATAPAGAAPAATPDPEVTPARSVLTPGSGPLAVAVVVPLTVRPTETGLLDAETLELYTSPAGALSRQLDQIIAAGVAIGLDPMIPASIRALGTAAPESAVEWLARLDAAPNEVFQLAYSDADLASLARIGRLDASRPLDLTFALDTGAFGAPETDPPSPGPDPTPTETADPDVPPPLPTTDDLLAWPGAIPGIAWPGDDGLSAADLPALSAAGYEHVLVTSANVSETSSALADLGSGMQALVADSTLSELARDAVGAIDDTARQDVLGRLGAALDGMAAAQPGRTVLITLDRAWPLGVYRLADVVASIAARPSSDLVGLSDVIGGPADSASVVEPALDPARTARIAAMVEGERAEQRFAEILTDPIQLTAPRRLELLSLLDVSWVRVGGDWDTASAEFLQDSADILRAVQIEESEDPFITSVDSRIPVRVSNALDFPVTVRIDARPYRPILRIQDAPEVTIEPGSSKVALLPVQAITNGRLRVDLQLANPATDQPIGDMRPISVELQAQWETVGLIIGAVVAVVFAAGIVRNIVVRRRRSRAEAADGVAEPADG